LEKKSILVIGAGVVGTLIAREISKSNCQISVFEKLPDVGWGVTKANSGIIHAGYGDNPNSNRAKYCAKGNALYKCLSEELQFDFERIGSLVLAFNEMQEKTLYELLEQGHVNGVEGLEILNKEKTLSMEPSVNPLVKKALFAPSAGIVAPWEIAIAAFENSKENGADYFFNTEVNRFFKQGKKVIVETNSGVFEFDFVINASGIFSDEIALKSGMNVPKIYPRKGEYILLDENELVRKIIFPTPGEKGKGILVVPTVHDSTLLGPTAEDLPETMKENAETTFHGLSKIIKQSRKLVPGIDLSKTIKTFAGLRPENAMHDFDISYGEYFVNLLAIRSPGLTAAPAIAREVADFIKEKFSLKTNRDFTPTRERIISIKDLSNSEKEKIIRDDPSFGNIVCRCNKVTEGEVIEAVKRGAKTIDGVKFRTSATFGRCQGAFCMVNIMKIISRELEIPFNRIEKNSNGSKILNGEAK